MVKGKRDDVVRGVRKIVLVALVVGVVLIAIVLRSVYDVVFTVETMKWTLSTLIQGLSAIYGLVLVFYVYFRANVESESRRLALRRGILLGEIEALSVGKGGGENVESKIAELGGIFDQAQQLRQGERFVFPRVMVFSVFFCGAVLVDIVGLVCVEFEVVNIVGYGIVVLDIFVAGVMLTSIAVVGLGFALTYYFWAVTKRTVARGLVIEGSRFFQKKFVKHMEREPGDMDWEGRYEYLRSRHRDFWEMYGGEEERIESKLKEKRDKLREKEMGRSG